jgi:hypothetical protein
MRFIQPARRTRCISWAPSGWLLSSTTAEICTDFVTVTCPDDFLAVRAGFTNIQPDPYVVTKVIVAASPDLGDHANPTGEAVWRPLTFANQGIASDNLVTAADAPTTIIVQGNQRDPATGEASIPRWTWTDWAPLPSLPRNDQPNAPRVLMLRALLPNGCTHTHPNGGFMEFRDTPAINLGSSYVAGHVPADVVTQASTVHAPGACLGIANSVVSCIQFLTRNEGIVGMAAGDSHAQGTSTTTQFWNYVMRASLALGSRHVGRIPFGYWSTAQGGAKSGQFFATLCNVLDVARPGFVVLPGWTYNDMSGTVHADHAANQGFFARLLLTAETCVKAGAIPIFLTPFPRDPGAMTPMRATAWRDLRAQILALQDSGAIVLDAASILGCQPGGILDGTYDLAFSDDTAHPNNAGHAAVAAALIPILERAFGLN